MARDVREVMWTKIDNHPTHKDNKGMVLMQALLRQCLRNSISIETASVHVGALLRMADHTCAEYDNCVSQFCSAIDGLADLGVREVLIDSGQPCFEKKVFHNLHTEVSKAFCRVAYPTYDVWSRTQCAFHRRFAVSHCSVSHRSLGTSSHINTKGNTDVADGYKDSCVACEFILVHQYHQWNGQSHNASDVIAVLCTRSNSSTRCSSTFVTGQAPIAEKSASSCRASGPATFGQ